MLRKRGEQRKEEGEWDRRRELEAGLERRLRSLTLQGREGWRRERKEGRERGREKMKEVREEGGSEGEREKEREREKFIDNQIR